MVIVHGAGMSYKEAIEKVFGHVKKNDDIMEKIKAYIPENQNFPVSCDDYSRISDKKCSLQPRARKIAVNSDCVFTDYSANTMVKLITARGNNDGRCSCCGMRLLDRKQLVITQNANSDTNTEYPQIVGVVCKECFKVLKASHANTQLIQEQSGWKVKYLCNISTLHEQKKLLFTCEICDGVRNMCKT